MDFGTVTEFCSDTLLDFDKRNYTLSVFLDLSKAFDTIAQQEMSDFLSFLHVVKL